MTLGQKIKKYRTEKGLTQKDLAEQVHVTFQTVSKWENDENEPDITTIRELAKLFGCSLNDLLSEDDHDEPIEDDPEMPLPDPDDDEHEKPLPDPKNKPLPDPIPVPVPPKETIIIHETEKHVCERCKLDIDSGDLEIDQILVSRGGRGRHPVYRPGYFHKKCLAELRREREEAEKKAKAVATSGAKKKCFGWGIAAGVIALVLALLAFFMSPSLKESVHPALAILYSILIGYAGFSMIYCILSGSYIGDVFLWCAGLSIKFPGIIFSWDLGGLAFLIVMKLLFAAIGFLIGVAALLFAIVLSALLGFVSFPFVLIHNNHTGYEDAF